MAERITPEDQARVLEAESSSVECVRETCFMLREYLKLKIFMFAAACLQPNRYFNGDDLYLGSIYFSSSDGNLQFGSLDVYEIQTGGGKVILPGVSFHRDLSPQSISIRQFGPTSFHPFPNRTDYINIHQFQTTFQEVFRREYLNSEVDRDVTSNDARFNVVGSTSMDRRTYNDARYRRMTMCELSAVVQSRLNPCSPDMKDIEQRLRSFIGLGLNAELSADQARAGFFATGHGDQAECYHCGLRLYVWDETPIVMHVRWAPRCRYLRDNYSPDFINDILFNRK
ncbi:uncharacterized protein LOC132550452 [Ylistrum balloti]|uniref:uncharacterized protein LOC132550452 n=1 Tax=Ylistrum balloti TaxID=509963 RepID=UPI002905A511|nr:uncharacterized protein LOC132550452 [Ylistrum balloti]